MRTAERKPNIVFIVLDTHRLDRLGCYGCPRGTSPNLDAFAQGATLFENAISPAQWTIPSHASMFSGEPPTTHMALQSGDMLDPRFKTLAEHLRSNGYRTIGFCNNPLVGVINNGFRRGFEAFYNYGGAIPSAPARPSKRLVKPLRGIVERCIGALRRLSYSIQDVFANSSQMFQAALNPFWVPLWTRVANFKGDTSHSIRDVTSFVTRHTGKGDEQPYFLFVNLMETHFPFSAPRNFVDTFVPYFREERAARDFMRSFNAQAVRWITPMDKPFSELEARTLNDMYDAEVAYQDHLLADLLAALDRPEHRANTMVTLVADHGEMLGEHQMMGHSFGVYQELVHVPLMIRFPEQTTGRRVAAPVSTTRLFHTVLDVAGAALDEAAHGPAAEVIGQSLVGEGLDAHRSGFDVVSEAYPPEFALNIVQAHAPNLMEKSRCQATHWAMYEDWHKLIHIEDVGDTLFALDADPRELQALASGLEVECVRRMTVRLEAFLERARGRRSGSRERRMAELDDKVVRQRLRSLGYLD
jgi:arylsulfatase A-like enzyme